MSNVTLLPRPVRPINTTVKLLPRPVRPINNTVIDDKKDTPNPSIVDNCKKDLLKVTTKCHLDNVFQEYGEHIFKMASLSLDKKSRDKLIAISLIISYDEGYMSIYIARHGKDMFLQAYSEDTPEKLSILQTYEKLSLLFGW